MLKTDSSRNTLPGRVMMVVVGRVGGRLSGGGGGTLGVGMEGGRERHNIFRFGMEGS